MKTETTSTTNGTHREVAIWAYDEEDHRMAVEQVSRAGYLAVPRDRTSWPPRPQGTEARVAFAALPKSDQKPLLKALALLVSSIPTTVPVLFSVCYADLSTVGALLTMFRRDFVVHGASPQETTFRLESLMRAGPVLSSGDFMTFGKYQFFRLGHFVFFEDSCVKLQRAEFEVALFLFNHAGTTISREKLHSIYAGVDALQGRSVDALISKIRAKLQMSLKAGAAISSVRGRGYQLDFF